MTSPGSWWRCSRCRPLTARVLVWDAALASSWVGPDLWVHGDMVPSNLLVRDDRLCGVIDFGCSAVGDQILTEFRTGR